MDNQRTNGIDAGYRPPELEVIDLTSAIGDPSSGGGNKFGHASDFTGGNGVGGGQGNGHGNTRNNNAG